MSVELNTKKCNKWIFLFLRNEVFALWTLAVSVLELERDDVNRESLELFFKDVWDSICSDKQLCRLRESSSGNEDGGGGEDGGECGDDRVIVEFVVVMMVMVMAMIKNRLTVLKK